MMTDQKSNKIRVAVKRVSEIVTTISEHDILRINKDNRFVVGGKELPDDEAEYLLGEAKILKNGKLWKYLSEDMLYSSATLLLKKGKNTDDIIFHRAVEYVLTVLQKKIDYLEKMQYNKEVE